jgi:hypothetical protein
MGWFGSHTSPIALSLEYSWAADKAAVFARFVFLLPEQRLVNISCKIMIHKRPLWKIGGKALVFGKLLAVTT